MSKKKKNNIFYCRYFLTRFTLLWLFVYVTTDNYAQKPVSGVGNLLPEISDVSSAANFSGQNIKMYLKVNRHSYDVSGDSLSTFKKYDKSEKVKLSAFDVGSDYSIKPIVKGQQETATLPEDSVPTMDLTDVIRKVLKKNVDTIKTTKSGGIAILPTFGYNPSLGFQIGAKVAAAKQFGDPKNTSASVFGLIAVYTTKGIINLQAIHNLFTAENKMNWQGNWQLTFFQVTDYGLGTGKNYPDSADIIKYKFLRFFEKAYFKVGRHLYLGGGVNFNIRIDIKDNNQSDSFNTAHQTYSLENGFDPARHSVNGLLWAIQYISRDHPFRAYRGIYADLNLLSNQKWLGSTKGSFQAQVDFRKYWSLTTRNPAHVLAFWHLAAYKLGGKLPYLELANTANDAYARSGRGYTIGRFRGPSYFYLETEYRFPITRNQLISGVCFINTQSAANSANKELLKSWATAGGGGLRVLFQKQSRSTICFDYAVGQYGAKGFFIGLNEAF